jgi:hypothetical protein
LRLTLAAVLFLAGGTFAIHAQGNYEVQVYGSELVPKGVTMVEIHSNFTAKGFAGGDGLYATRHAEHETLEITHGFNEWFETGFYQFTSIQPDGSYQWVGTHIRPRFSVPERYKLPVGLSLSQEIGYQRPGFDPNTWSWELRPIVDKQLGKFYMSFNPVFEKSLHGPNKDKGWDFSPNVKFAYNVHKLVALGMEYYGAYGHWNSWDSVRDTEQMFVPAADIDFGKRWEFNFGIGVGVTQATDHLLIKCILGYRLGKLKD